MGDDPSPTPEEEVTEVEIEIGLDSGIEGFAETFREAAEELPAEEQYPADYLDLTGPDEDPPDWGRQDEDEDEELLALGDRPPRTRGQRAGVKAQRQRLTKAAAIARALIVETAAEARRANQPAEAARGRPIPAASAAPRTAPQFLTREQAELRNASRSRSAASDRQGADRPRRPASRRREPSQARGQRRPESRPVYTERVDSDYLYADYRDQRNRGHPRGPDYGTVPAAKASRRRGHSNTARDRSPSLAPPGHHWARKVRSGSVRAPRSPSPEPEGPPLHSAAGSGIARGSASSARPRSQSVSLKSDRPDPRTPTAPSPEPVRTDLAYLEAQAQLANAKVTAARQAQAEREAARVAAAEESARLGIEAACDHAKQLDRLRQLIRATDPKRPVPTAPGSPQPPLPADIEGSLRNYSPEQLADLAASFASTSAAATARVRTPPPAASKAPPPRRVLPDPEDVSHPDWRDPKTGKRYDPWAAAATKVIPRLDALGAGGSSSSASGSRPTYVEVVAAPPPPTTGTSSAASSAGRPADRGLTLLAQPTTQRPYRVVVDFHNVLDIGPPPDQIPASLGPALRSLKAEFPRLEFEVLSFCTTRDRRDEVHRRVNQFETLVGGGGARSIFATVGTCDERTGKPRWKKGAWNSGGKDFHCCLNRCDALIDDHPGICLQAYRAGVNVFPIRTRGSTHRGNTSYNNVFLALEALGQQLRADPNKQSDLLSPNQV
ncbi:unnamed protein product [Polarella glacialis]|uniref:Uncharacterized protein n=1 Tax=Polarella glacialis TaxID=89957 RepID=A0A813J2D8_POLGL|nr:unnamed protein product [Polarella glacialis]